VSLSDGGIGSPPDGLLELSDWNVSSPRGCIADVLAFEFASTAKAASFAKQQADGMVAEDVGGITVWFSASRDAARLAIGSLALSVIETLEPPDTTTMHDLVQSIIEATPATP
jgi:hypothetical protein